MPGPTARRRRADADRNVAVILTAAIRVLGTDPRSTMDDIATAAGLTRQTVYAHFPNRDALYSAVLDRVTAEAVADLEAAALNDGPATAALLRMLDINWRLLARYPLLVRALPPVDPATDAARHRPVLDRLEPLIRRGRATGEFDAAVPISWLLAATVALGHAAGEEVTAGRMTTDEAAAALRRGILRVYGATDPSA